MFFSKLIELLFVMKFVIFFHICSIVIVRGLAQPDGSNHRNVDSSLEEVESFRKEVIKRGETLILTEFPKKISFLNKLLGQPQWNEENLDNLHEDINIPIPDPVVNKDESIEKKFNLAVQVEPSSDCCANVYKFANGMAPSNKKISELNDTVKLLAGQLFEDCEQVELWLRFMVPKIEDGNNFGVSIQEDVLEKVQSAGELADSILVLLSEYYIERSEIVAKVAKYPHVEDYRKAVDEYDNKQYFRLKGNLRRIRNIYSLQRDLVLKNLEKLKEPRSSSKSDMYE